MAWMQEFILKSTGESDVSTKNIVNQWTNFIEILRKYLTTVKMAVADKKGFGYLLNFEYSCDRNGDQTKTILLLILYEFIYSAWNW